MNLRQHNPAHPGTVLRHYLDLEHSSVAAIAAHLRVSRVTLSRVLNGKAGISPAMSLKLAQALGTSAEMWVNMQAKYDLWQARKNHPRLSIRPLPKAHRSVA